MEDPITVNYNSPRPRVRMRYWRLLCIWLALLAATVIGQWFSAGTFKTGHWTPDGNTPETLVEKLWYRLPLAAIVLTSLLCFVAARWLIQEKRGRSITRIWGVLAALGALLVSMSMSFYYSFFIWYMD